MTIESETLKEGGNVLEKLSKPGVFAPALCIILLILFAYFVYLFRQDWREEAQAKVRILNDIALRLEDVHEHLIFLGAQKTERDRREEEMRRRPAPP